MKRTIITAVLVAALAVAGLSTASGAGADTGSAQFTGRAGELVDDSTEGTSWPTGNLRHVGVGAPDSYAHDYQWATPVITTPAGAVAFEGTIDVTDAVAGDYAFIGLLDTATLAAGDRGRYEGSYISVDLEDDDTLVLGLSDGKSTTGEYTQVFHTIDLTEETDRVFDVIFTINPDGDVTECASASGDEATAEGCLTLAIDELSVLEDSYGTITADAATNDGVEFRDGGTAGWDAPYERPEGTGIEFDLTVTPVTVLEAETKDDCKDGKWQDYGYENQGQCVATVVKA